MYSTNTPIQSFLETYKNMEEYAIYLFISNNNDTDWESVKNNQSIITNKTMLSEFIEEHKIAYYTYSPLSEYASLPLK